ncbi:hypothetical protein pb186bvf_005311 [Paramecium bursaria]
MHNILNIYCQGIHNIKLISKLLAKEFLNRYFIKHKEQKLEIVTFQHPTDLQKQYINPNGHIVLFFIEYQMPERDNLQLAQRIRNNEIQENFLALTLNGGFVRVRENQQFKTQMEQDVMQHFTFMLRTSFYNGLFDEITNFIQIYNSQFEQSVQIYQVWQQIGQSITNTNDKMIMAQNQLDAIHQYNTSGVTNEEFLQLKKDDTKKFLDKKFMQDEALKQREREQNMARIRAQAETIISEGRLYLDWLRIQSQSQQKFSQDLSIIQRQWDYDYKTFLDGRGFIDTINLNQIEIFRNREWQMQRWAQQLNQQIQQATPYFTQLYTRYMGCYRFYLDNYELDQLTLNRQQIQETQIEIAGRKAEQRYNEAFISYWNDQLIEATRTLKVFKTNDQVKRLQECHTKLTKELMKVQQAYQNLSVNVTRDDGKATNVDLVKTNFQIQIENPYDVKDSKETKNQEQKIKHIKQQIIYFQEEIKKLEYAEQRLKELQKLPQLLRQEIDLKYGDKIGKADIFQAQFDDLLRYTEIDNYNDLCFGRQGLIHFLGAFSKYLVIKQVPCCNCFFGSKKIHQKDDIYYNEYEDQAAIVIRQIQNESNSWFTSAKERIEGANHLRVIQMGTRLIINSNILAAFRNEDGQRQINGGFRVFNAYSSIVYTINELCKLAVVDYKSQIGLNTFTEREFQTWQQCLNDAKNGILAQNQIVPE